VISPARRIVSRSLPAKGADPALRHDDLAGLGRDGWMDRRAVVIGQPAGVAEGGERAVARADLGVARAERHAHEDDADPRGAGGGERARDALQQTVVGEAVHDPALDVHDQERGRVGH
jgi:hypothetical protein